MNKLQLIISIASNKTLLLKAIKIALFVGIVLNLINQGEKIFILAFEDINYYKFFLTFIVPFSVSMYTAITMKLNLHVEKKQ
ncbi:MULTISPECIES: nitrate/nitrite transporter NrtS [Arcobacteraceae]|uniref:nitrate/nitrite transporter NrtS n=1 Tax=Arcobacteraceae TaxID=2808963 RepID=UPI0009FA65DA|nr:MULTISPECIES: nitrate/nitrite transporter NrtS [Arcobacteraceae]